MPKKIKMTIGEFSKFCRVTAKTLRYYDKMGLLVPHEVDEWTRYRYYDVSQMRQLNNIRRLKHMGFSLEEISNLLGEGQNRPSVEQIENKIAEVSSQIVELQAQLAALKRMGESMKQIDSMNRITLQRLPAIIVASHRCVLQHREDLTPLFQNTIDPEIQRIGCQRSVPIYGFTIEHDKDYKTENVDMEYCLQVEQMYEDTAIIKFRQIDEVPLAVCLKHTGAYDTFHESFTEVMRYIEENGFEVSGPFRIQFEESIYNQDDPEKWVTIIQVPVEKRVVQNRLPNEMYYQ